MRAREGRPVRHSERPSQQINGSHATASVSPLPDIADLLRAEDWDKIAEHIDGAYVLLVKTTAGRYRRRCFLTVASAERAVQRAQERGENAVVVLAELKPLYRVVGGLS